MKKLLLFFFTVFFCAALHAENVLVLTKPDSSQSHIFRKGSFLVFELKSDGSIREGFIRGITDSSLVFDNAQVSLSQIIILAGSTKGKVVAGRIANAMAHGLIFTGSVLFNCGLEFFVHSDSYYYWPLGGAIWFGGAVIAGVGHVFDWAAYPLDYAVRVRNYRGWSAAIQGTTSIEEKSQSFASDAPQEIALKEETKKEKKKKKKKVVTGDDVYE